MSEGQSILDRLQRAPENVLLGFAGDTMIGRLVNEQLRSVSAEYPWGNLLPFLHATDANIANLETALTTSDDVVEKVFNFKSDPKNVQTLVEAGFKWVNIANNHVLDYSVSGFEETLNMLKSANIGFCGAGRNNREAASPLIFTDENITFGMLGLTDNEPGWKATGTSPGVRYVEIGDLPAISGDIEELRNRVDVVIVSMHWGPNMRERPPAHFIDFAHDLVDLGVDIIHGHSAHIFQGVELYRNALIMYDTGDFVDDYRVDPALRNDRSFFFCVEVSDKGFERLVMVPTLISNCQVNLAIGEDKEESMERMRQLSLEHTTEVHRDDGYLVVHRKGERGDA